MHILHNNTNTQNNKSKSNARQKSNDRQYRQFNLPVHHISFNQVRSLWVNMILYCYKTIYLYFPNVYNKVDLDIVIIFDCSQSLWSNEIALSISIVSLLKTVDVDRR